MTADVKTTMVYGPLIENLYLDVCFSGLCFNITHNLALDHFHHNIDLPGEY